MIAYFTASVVGKKHYLENYKRIIEIVKSKKIEIISDHIMNISEEEINLQTLKERLGFYNRLEKWIKSSNFVIVEASFPSISVGFEISLALNLGKPVLVLYSGQNPPSLLAYHKDEKLVCEKYSFENLESVIEQFVNYIKGATDTRFTFFITSEIALYLDKLQKNSRTPKSVYLRRLIENDMRSAGKNRR